MEKLAELYFLIQHLSLPRFYLKVEYIENLEFYIAAFSDGSVDFSAACMYIISLDKVQNTSSVQLITTSSKIQNLKTDSIITVPQNETYASWLGSEILLRVCEIMSELKLPIKKTFLFIDAISTLISLSHHLAKYKDPFRRLLASTNVNLFKVAQLSGQTKESVPLFLNQNKCMNFADLLTKFHIQGGKPSLRLEYQKRLLSPSWLLQHPRFWEEQVILESREKISIQEKGKVMTDFSRSGGQDIEPPQWQ